MATPFVKWAGGKGKLAPRIVAGAPAAFVRYHEPFAGGAAVFFALRTARGPFPAALNDSTAALVEAFAAVRDRLPELLDALEVLQAGYLAQDPAGRAAFYYAQRNLRRPRTPVARAARLIFLNRTCYNGLYRVNRNGGFNVPHGEYANPRIMDEPGLTACSEALQGVDLTSGDFETACERAQPGDFVYLDPPYYPINATSNFTSYTSDSFGREAQARLRDTFESLTRRGVHAILSNSSVEPVHDLYGGGGYRLETVSMSRAINSNAAGRAPIEELLIDNFERVSAVAAPAAGGS